MAGRGRATPHVDLHVHLLPGVDDGPATMADAIELARLLIGDGAGTVVATPHAGALPRGELGARVRELRSALLAAGVALDVVQGAEVAAGDVPAFGRDELETMAIGPRGARWVLLEPPFGGPREVVHEAADVVRGQGLGVVVAHPERSAGLMRGGCEGLRRERALGALALVSADSLAGRFGGPVERRAVELVAEGLADAVASDAHSPRRPPLVSEARRRLLAAGVAPERVAEAIDVAPRALLERGVGAAAAAPTA